MGGGQGDDADNSAGQGGDEFNRPKVYEEQTGQALSLKPPERVILEIQRHSGHGQTYTVDLQDYELVLNDGFGARLTLGSTSRYWKRAPTIAKREVAGSTIGLSHGLQANHCRAAHGAGLDAQLA